jgi:hypothetical protein
MDGILTLFPVFVGNGMNARYVNIELLDPILIYSDKPKVYQNWTRKGISNEDRKRYYF